MLKLRTVLLTEMLMAAAVVVGVVRPLQERRTAMGEQVHEALAIPGTGLGAMTDAQAVRLATRIDEQMRMRFGTRRGLESFLHTAELMAQSGTMNTLRVYDGNRTFGDVLIVLGRLMREEQRLSQGGQRSAAAIKRLVTARGSGVPDEKVHRMSREVERREELATVAAADLRQVQKQIDDLVRVLVEGEQALDEWAVLRKMDREVMIRTHAAGRDELRGDVRVGWL